MLSERSARIRTQSLGWGSLTLLLVVGTLTKSGTILFYLALVFPWIAALVYRTGDGVIQLIVGKHDPRPNVAHVFVFSCLFPGLWAFNDGPTPLHWPLVLLLSVIVASVLSAVAARNLKSWHRAELLILLVVTSGYGFGVVTAFNQDLDSRAQQIYAPQVLAKRTMRWSRTPNYYVKVAPWGPQQSAREIEVSQRVYERTPVGEQVFVHFYPGALHIPWFYASSSR